MSTKSNPIKFDPYGLAHWDHQIGDRYVVTGVDVNGKRFKAKTFYSWHHAKCVNLYRGNYWLLRNNRRYRIQSVWN